MILSSMVFAVLARNQVPRLIENSTLIAETKNWFGVTAYCADYHWLDAEKILYMTEGERQTMVFHTYNIVTKRTADNALSAAYKQSDGSFDSIEVSPDGKKVFWSGRTGKQSKWFVADCDGKNVGSFDRRKTSVIISNHGPDDETTLTWGPDGKSVYESIVEFGNGTSTSLWYRSIPPLDREQKLPTAKGYVDFQPRILPGNIAFATSGLAMGGERKSAGFITWNVNNPGRTRREWTVTVPKNRTISMFSHSHDGNRILWDLTVHDPKNPDQWAGVAEDFFLTDATGKGWQIVANLPFDKNNSGEQRSKMSGPQWTIDDKALSYVYMGKLYLFKLP